MERTPHLLPRHQVFLDLAGHFPEVDTTLLETYWVFLQGARQALDAQHAFYDRYGLSEGKLVVLVLLHQAPHSPLTPSALAEAAGVTRGTMTGLLSGLERSGLVQRVEHPEDGRMFHIELTKAARDLLEQILPERFHHIMEGMSLLTLEEQHQLRTLLEKLKQGHAALSTS